MLRKSTMPLLYLLGWRSNRVSAWESIAATITLSLSVLKGIRVMHCSIIPLQSFP